LAETRAEKPIGWRGSALGDLQAFPEEARREAGYQLHLLQQGNTPDDWKPVPVVGPGTLEVRIHADGERRVFVVAKFAEAVYVLHVFHKKTQKTSTRDIDLAKRRYNDVMRERRRL
jgi:phage-related protein